MDCSIGSLQVGEGDVQAEVSDAVIKETEKFLVTKEMLAGEGPKYGGGETMPPPEMTKFEKKPRPRQRGGVIRNGQSCAKEGNVVFGGGYPPARCGLSRCRK